MLFLKPFPQLSETPTKWFNDARRGEIRIEKNGTNAVDKSEGTQVDKKLKSPSPTSCLLQLADPVRPVTERIEIGMGILKGSLWNLTELHET